MLWKIKLLNVYTAFNSSPFIAASSTFEIIIGDVELGQRPELLEKAAQPESEVRAFVTEDQQTAVAAHGSRIRLDWSQWIEDELGSAAGSANYTIYSTLLNETGGIDGPLEVLQPTPPDSSRIIVRIDPEANEFYVEILSVNVAGAAEFPDNVMYELEACYFEDDGSRDCERTSITLYAIGQPPILITADEDGKIINQYENIYYVCHRSGYPILKFHPEVKKKISGNRSLRQNLIQV